MAILQRSEYATFGKNFILPQYWSECFDFANNGLDKSAILSKCCITIAFCNILMHHMYFGRLLLALPCWSGWTGVPNSHCPPLFTPVSPRSPPPHYPLHINCPPLIKFCSGIQFYVLLGPYLCFITFFISGLYVLGNDSWIS